MKYAANIKLMNNLANQLAAQTNLGEVYSFPEKLTILPSKRCNYSCIYCGTYCQSDAADMSRETLDKILEVLPFVSTVYVTGGEPLMWSGIWELFDAAAECGCDLSMVSNGSLLTEANRNRVIENRMSFIKFSIDAGTQAGYGHIRKGNFAKVMANIAKLNEAKLKAGMRLPRTQFGFVGMKSNVAELSKLLVVAKSIGVDEVSFAYCHINYEELIPESLFFHQEYSDECLLRAAEVAKRIGISLKLPALFNPEMDEGHIHSSCSRVRTACVEPWRTAFLQPDGTVYMCCGGGGYSGNLAEAKDFAEVWNNPRRVAFRKQINTDNPPGPCKVCFQCNQASASNFNSHFRNAAVREKAIAWARVNRPGLLPELEAEACS